ncbi:hypothetical protein GCM10011611_62100 [Aliidongia dinghuensis]|uniref:Uncharacterized protein n=1 Tax=Aliidongia dinghuensis TaxID=1867774 RepID=A0A8J3E5G6_9PROT|nr:hypothetical protein [Aliidongia dinghuensis]GGF47264.1 hypothetical protein GCM10011611_62100 [Aliidongia dinghuensis]
MATIRISYDGGTVPVVMGDRPDDELAPIAEPVPTGFETNALFIVVEGIYCFSLQTEQRFHPPWLVVQAVDGDVIDIVFRTLP